jgi:hypothetical protein
VTGDSVVEDEAVVGGSAKLTGNIRIGGNSEISGSDSEDVVPPRRAGNKGNPSLSALVAGIGAIGLVAIVGGVILLIVGINMHFHNSSESSLCSSAVGTVGQALDPQVQGMYNHASELSLLGVLLALVGLLGISWGIKVAIDTIGGLALAKAETNSEPVLSTKRADRDERAFGELKPDATIFTCHICNEEFLGWDELAVHTKYDHEGSA